MEQKKFYTIIDGLTECWYIDANSPVKGTYKTTKSSKLGPRRKTNYRGEEHEPNTTTGEVQILKWAPRESMCIQCCKMAENKREEINLRNGQVKCSCGLKYPVIDIVIRKLEA